MRDYYITRINSAIDFIEMNYDRKLTTGELAKASAFSEYHFHRIFKEITGETVNGYIKRLKMGRAKRSIIFNDKSITDIAFDYGYSSSANFARDFKKFYNESATKLRREGIPEFKRSSSNINLEYLGIEDFDTIPVIYRRVMEGYNPGKIQEAFKALLDFIHKNSISYSDVTSIGIGYDDPDFIEADKCRYDACINIKEGINVDIGNFNKKSLSPGKCAVYVIEGKSEDFALAWDFIFKIWLRSESYTIADRPHFEIYLNSEKHTEGIFRAKLCLPITLKK